MSLGIFPEPSCTQWMNGLCWQHNDWKSVERLCVGIVKICRECKDNTALNEHVVLLAKRYTALLQVHQ